MRKWSLIRGIAEKGMILFLVLLLVVTGGAMPYSAYGAQNTGTLALASDGERVVVERGDRIPYPQELGGGWATFYYYLDGKLAYCVEPSKSSPPSGTEVSINPLAGNEFLQKVLYYGYGGPGDCTDEVLNFDDPALKYVFTHLAASYAYCGMEAFQGCTQEKLESCGVWFYINYIQSLSPVPDAALQMSANKWNATLVEGSQRTGEIQLLGDSRNQIWISLPEDVTLHNITKNLETTGEKVMIQGGDRFYFSAPLTVTGTFSTGKLYGTLTDEWKAILTSADGGNQTLGSYQAFTVETKPVSLEIQWLSLTGVSICKSDYKTGQPIAGVVYGIYTDSGCTKLLQKLPPTSAEGRASSNLFPFTQDTCYLKEIEAPQGYVVDPTVYPVKVTPGEIQEVQLTDKNVKGCVKLTKVDKDSNQYEPQGDASLKGAVYGLYAREAIIHPDQKTGVLFEKDRLVSKKTFESDQSVRFTELWPGRYYIRELQAPPGYLLDKNELEIEISGEGEADGKEVSLVSREAVMKQAFQLLKVSGAGDCGELPSLAGAEFTVKLESEVEKAGFDQATVYDILVTDEKGAAVSKELPYGTYLVRETKAPENYAPVPDFTVKIDKDSRTPQFWRVFQDKNFSAYIKMKKIDKESKQEVLLAGTVFRIKNKDTGNYVTQKVGGKEISEFVTDETGTVTTSLKLESGNYELTEIKAPDGYLMNQNPVSFQVGEEGAVEQPDGSRDVILEVEMEDNRQYGGLKIQKSGDVLTGFEEDFFYETKLLSGVEFLIRAGEDILSWDHQRDKAGNPVLAEYQGKVLKKGTEIARLSTDAEGCLELKGLPFGMYLVEEIRTWDGLILKGEPIAVELKSKGQEEVVMTKLQLQNERKVTKLSIRKSDADSGQVLSGAVFGIYTAEKIVDAEGKTLLEKDKLIEKITTDKDGMAEATAKLPLGRYYICELEAPEGYEKDNEQHAVELLSTGQAEREVAVHLELSNKKIPAKKTVKPVETGQKNTVNTAKVLLFSSIAAGLALTIGILRRRKKYTTYR